MGASIADPHSIANARHCMMATPCNQPQTAVMKCPHARTTLVFNYLIALHQLLT